jgi:hypothetical protein
VKIIYRQEKPPERALYWSQHCGRQYYLPFLLLKRVETRLRANPNNKTFLCTDRSFELHMRAEKILFLLQSIYLLNYTESKYFAKIWLYFYFVTFDNIRNVRVDLGDQLFKVWRFDVYVNFDVSRFDTAESTFVDYICQVFDFHDGHDTAMSTMFVKTIMVLTSMPAMSVMTLYCDTSVKST